MQLEKAAIKVGYSKPRQLLPKQKQNLLYSAATVLMQTCTKICFQAKTLGKMRSRLGKTPIVSILDLNLPILTK
jgi:hypothetical protein